MNRKLMNKVTIAAASLFLLVGISNQALAIMPDDGAGKTTPGKLLTKKELTKVEARKPPIVLIKPTRSKKMNVKNIKPINGTGKKTFKKITADKLHKPKKQ